MKKTLVALGLIAMMVLGVTYVYAHGPGRGHGWRGEACWESEDPGQASTLSEEQKAKFDELRQKYVDETAQLKGSILTKRLELQSLWSNPKSDPKVITDKERELRDLQNQMRDKAVQFKLEARNSLTPEQIEEFGQGWGMGHGFGPGHMRGYGHRSGRGYGKGPGSGHGMGPGYGPCN